MKRGPRRRNGLRLLVVTIVAAVVGVLATQPLLRYLIDRHAIRNGPWRTGAETGSATANPYERAAVALTGLYALTRKEAIYYTAFTDGDGRTLRGECSYRISGSPPPARWWSLTVYGADHFLVPNPAGVYARHAGNLPVSGDGRYDIELAANPELAGGLPIPSRGPFSMTLRLYNPPPEVLRQLATLPLPTITRRDCR